MVKAMIKAAEVEDGAQAAPLEGTYPLHRQYTASQGEDGSMENI